MTSTVKMMGPAMPYASGFVGITKSPLRFMHRLAAHDSTDDRDVFDLVWLHTVRIVCQHHEIRELAGGNRPFDGFFPRRVRAVHGVDAYGFVHGDALIRTPRRPVPARTRHHA